MSGHWYQPLTLSEWLKRTFSVLNMAVVLLTAGFIFSEFRTDWFEQIVGAYLVSTNADRPETGVVWEVGKQASSAHQYLNTIISKKETIRRNVNQSDSFSALASNLLPGEWVILETNQFKSLYLALGKSMAFKIIDPVRLVWLLNGDSLDRIFCEGVKGGIKLLFIDSENRVIQEIDLNQEDIADIETGDRPVPGILTDMAEFRGRIYPAAVFFNEVLKLPSDIIPDLMLNPDTLLRQEGKITRVGIFNEAVNGFIRLGFEFDTPEGKQLLFLKGREWAIWQLSLNLKGDNR